MKNYFKTGALFSNGLAGIANILNLDGQSKKAAYNYGAFLGILFQLVGNFQKMIHWILKQIQNSLIKSLKKIFN